jgi:hypothetical protein
MRFLLLGGTAMRHSLRFGSLVICGIVTSVGCDLLDEPMYQASVALEKEWDVGRSPHVVADLFGGPIFVHPGRQGKVRASVKIGQTSKISQNVADSAVKASRGVAMTQDGDSIRLIESRGNLALCSLHLSVPAGVRLDLHAGAGSIYVGPDFPPSAPAALNVASLRARQDSVGVLTVNVTGPSSHSPPLDLEGDKLILTVNGLAVDVGPPMNSSVAGGARRWQYVSK